MHLRDLVLGSIMVIGIFLSITIFGADLYSNYGVITADNGTSYGMGALERIENITEDLDENIVSGSTDTEGGDYDILTGSYNGFKTHIYYVFSV